jgi:hypothetical protein
MNTPSDDHASHRHPDPEDARAFAAARAANLRSAVSDLALLLERGYGRGAAAGLVADRWRLVSRERAALLRLACSDTERDARARRRVDDWRGRRVVVDGFNVAITLECGLGGAVVLAARDGSTRDLASAARWRPVAETAPALHAACQAIAALEPESVDVLVDLEARDSGRLALAWRAAAGRAGLVAAVKRIRGVDAALVDSRAVVASSDSAVLDRAAGWCDLPGAILRGRREPVWWVPTPT